MCQSKNFPTLNCYACKYMCVCKLSVLGLYVKVSGVLVGFLLLRVTGCMAEDVTSCGFLIPIMIPVCAYSVLTRCVVVDVGRVYLILTFHLAYSVSVVTGCVVGDVTW